MDSCADMQNETLNTRNRRPADWRGVLSMFGNKVLAQRVRELCAEIGFVHRPRVFSDRLFLLAMVVGFVVAGMLRIFQPMGIERTAPLGLLIVFNWVIWSPLVEELLFRGIIQGQLTRLWHSERTLLGLSYANWLTSIIFTGVHFIYHPPLWAAAVLVPSLVFGYLRDRSGSVLPPMVLHGLYNAQFLLFFG
jgi:membrane protease YdiL (CAAX protease family)